ncbi:MAG: molybdenum cofactor biosynthesis protein MoaE [Phycisphaeraceae bacterium]
MSVHVYIVDHPLTEAAAWQVPTGAGAVLCFEGIARPHEDDRPIKALDYEAYQPMAERMLRRIGEEAVAEHGLLGLCVEHSTGRVAAGECSFRLRIASAHRKEGLAAMDQFIDRMKQVVPLWKQAVYVE